MLSIEILLIVRYFEYTYLAIVANTAYPRNHNNLLEGLLQSFKVKKYLAVI